MNTAEGRNANTLGNWIQKGSAIDDVVDLLWTDFFERLSDEKPSFTHECLKIIREDYFLLPWHEAYSFVEFIIANSGPVLLEEKARFSAEVNAVLEKEASGFRFVDRIFVPIVDRIELEEIEDSLKNIDEPAAIHLRCALEKLSDRTNPDYRNSVKESISAVESICKNISGKTGASLPDALDAIKKRYDIHPAFEIALNKMYAYTSDADGIRHGLSAKSVIDFADAKFFLVACSAFVNYLKSKS